MFTGFFICGYSQLDFSKPTSQTQSSDNQNQERKGEFPASVPLSRRSGG